MNERENYLRAVKFEGPEHIPVNFWFNGSCWNNYDQDDLFDLKEKHPLLFPNFQRPDEPIEPRGRPWQREDERYTDPWGCVWETSEECITGSVVEHPLEHWEDFADYLPPNPAKTKGRMPEGSLDWDEEAERIQRQKERGRLTSGSLGHGHNWLRLIYLRGYENVLLDMSDDEPRLRELIGMIESFFLYIVRRYMEMGVDRMHYGEDLGMQHGPMMSPAHFKKYLKPTWDRLMKPAREAGCVISMHSDGDIRDLAEDLLDLGVQCLNIQDLVNGIDWIRDNLKGRVCLALDIDRQNVVRFGTPEEVRDLIREEVEKLSSPRGGLMMQADIYPGIPVRNLDALMTALEDFCYRNKL
ncbi:MAG: uroporphyrinogen decarboxylase family protein [Candidatus Brocadiia bacterium]